MAKGTVKWFDPKKGYGFILNEEGQDVFVHYTGIDGEGFKCLSGGQVVEYEQFDSGRGPHGRNVQIIDVKASTDISTQHADSTQ